MSRSESTPTPDGIRALSPDLANQPENKYRSLFESLDIGFCLCELLVDDAGRPFDYRFLEVNPVFAEQTGLKDAAGKTALELVPNLEPSWIELYGRVALTGEPAHFEQGSDAMGRWFDVRASRIGAPGQRRFAILFQDISARRNAETQLARALADLRESKSRFDLVRDGAQVGFWFCDLPFDKLIWDDRVKEHFWLPSESDVTIETFYAQLHRDDRERTRLAIDESIANHTQYDIEYRTLSPDGREKWIRAIGRTFYDGELQPIRFDGVTFDISDQKRAEQELLEADRRKDEFLAMLAHELRNPLAPIRHAAQVLKVTVPGDANQQWARDVIERQTQHITQLVDDLLDVSRITQGKIALRPIRLAVASVIERAVEAIRPVAETRGQTLTVTLPEAPLEIEGDSTRLVQVLSNLLNNASKFSHDGGRIAVTTSAEGSQAVIRVTDDGVGIARELLPRVFELFTQADRSLDRSQGGLGIGLTLVRLLVDRHGGTVEASSDGPGRGSEFVVRLPLAAIEGASAVSPAQPPSPDVTHRGPLRVLVVEDNADSAEMLSVMLELHGYETAIASDGLAALEEAQRFQPNAILCDIGLPGMTGYEVAQRVRALPVKVQPRMVALTGYGQDDDRRRAADAGFDHHLVKPVEPQALFALLDSLLD
jgi:PAS domain S-box-containing protein